MKSKINKNIILLFFLCSLSSIAVAQDDNFMKIGGALRYNFYVKNYESETKTNDTQFTWDCWRLFVDGKQSGVIIKFQYIFYPTFGTHFLKKGWFGYDLTENLRVQLGVTQVPFGNLEFASHSWWFITPYYVGLEDDHDMGIKFLYNKDNLELAFAYFLQPEPSGYAEGDVSYGIGGSARYSYDVIPANGQSNQEKHQFNARGAYKFIHSENINTKLGVSLQYGGIYNNFLDEMHSHYAYALHLDGNYGHFNVKAQYNYHNYDVRDDLGNTPDIVWMGAYGSGTYAVAAKMAMYSLGVSYYIPVKLGPISSFTIYNDYTYSDKINSDFEDSVQDVLGTMIVAGPMYIYVDLAMGINHAWLTDSFGTGFGQGIKDAKLNSRFNINFGYYF